MPKKYCRKFQPPEQGARALQTDNRQTDGRAIAYNDANNRFMNMTLSVLVTTAQSLYVICLMPYRNRQFGRQ